MQEPKPTELVALDVRRRNGATRLLLITFLLLAAGHVVFYLVMEHLVLGRATSVADRHARLHDLGGLFLVAWQFPLSAAVTVLFLVYFRRTITLARSRFLWAISPRRWIVGAASAATVLGATWFGIILDGGASGVDDHAYLFQAALILRGKVVLTFPWEGFSRAFTWPWMVDHAEHYSSFQMPGHCVLLTLGLLLKSAWVLPAIQGGIMVVATHYAARKMFGSRTALLASLLLVTSPYMVVTQGSYSAATSGAMCVALVLVAASRVLNGRVTVIRAAALGLSIALLWFVRPPTAAACALPIGVTMLCSCLRARARFRHLLITIVTAVVGLMPYLLYCRAVTGGWSMSPGDVYGGRLAGPEMSWLNVFSSAGHDIVTSIPNLITAIIRLNCYLFGWPVSLAPLAILLWSRTWRSPNGWLLATCGLLFAFYCLSEKILGWYLYELIPCLAILGARGVLELKRWTRRRRPGRHGSAMWISALVLASCAGAVTVTLPATMLRQAYFVREWTAPIRWIAEQIPRGQAIVFFDARIMDGATRHVLSGTNDPYLTARIIYARSGEDPNLIALVRHHFPARTAYQYSRDRVSGAHSLELLPPLRPEGACRTPSEPQHVFPPNLVRQFRRIIPATGLSAFDAKNPATTYPRCCRDVLSVPTLAHSYAIPLPSTATFVDLTPFPYSGLRSVENERK